MTAAVVAAPAQDAAQAQAEPSVGTVVARPQASQAEAGAISNDGAKGQVTQPAKPADDKPAAGAGDAKDPAAVVPISAKNPGSRPTDGGKGDWMKLVPPPGASPLTKDLIAATEKAIRFAVDLMGREHTVAPPPEVATLLKSVKAEGVGTGQLTEVYAKALGKSQQTKDSLLAMDDKVKQTSQIMADDKSKNMAAIKTIVAKLKERMAPFTGKLTAAQDYALMRIVGDALRKICERIVEAADHNRDIAHGGGNSGGSGGGIPGAGGGGQQGGGGQAGGGGDGGLGGLLSMLPMLGMLPISLIPMLPMLTELFNGEGDKQAEDKKAEGGGPPPPPPGESKPPEGQAAAPGDPNKPAEGATANDPNKPTGDPAKPQEQKPAEPKDAAAGTA
ncbi:hypothetical protein ACFXNW_20415 [Nocardia sp. NPDC059180]|uniref:hypothetical protein n=1 Tax=Nocardia sp. NPDC059180 TaxID=3346761 RepID=UPI0036B8F1B9